MYKLFARAGWGSVIVEAQLAWYGLRYKIAEVGDLQRSEAARAALVSVNPLAQIPTLVLPNGEVMTESAAITLYLADVTRRNDLVPVAHAGERAAFLRWLVFIVANIYPTFTYADVPTRFVADADADKAFRERVDQYAQQLWRQMEMEASAPWFLGAHITALDIFVTAMTTWRPRRTWFAEHCPRLHTIALAGEAVPALAVVWRRNATTG